MIRSFKCKETERIFSCEYSKKFPAQIQQIALRKLRMLNRSSSLKDVSLPPANRLEKLHGDCKQRWSIRINDQWRICFDWLEGDKYNVEIVDYH